MRVLTKRRNIGTSFRIIKKIYKCKNTSDLQKAIAVRCAPGKSATGHSSFEEPEKYAIICWVKGV